MRDGDVVVVDHAVVRRVQTDPTTVVVDLHPSVRRPLAAQQSGDVARGEADVAAYGQHDMRVILAHALALRERLFGGRADGGGQRRVDERPVHLVHHLARLVDRRAVGRQRRDAPPAHVDHGVDGRPRNGQRGIEAIQGLVYLRFDIRVVDEGDARHRIVEHGVRFGDEAGHHDGIEGIDGGVELHIGFDLHRHVHDLLPRAGGGDAPQLESMVGHRRAEGKLHLVIKHQFLHVVLLNAASLFHAVRVRVSESRAMHDGGRMHKATYTTRRACRHAIDQMRLASMSIALSMPRSFRSFMQMRSLKSSSNAPSVFARSA